MFSEELFSSSILGSVREDVPQAYGHLPVCGTNGQDRSRLKDLSSRGESVQLCSECYRLSYVRSLGHSKPPPSSYEGLGGPFSHFGSF